tara:strand:- start:80 stop:433 length:354 start_codon:yes stop_codon:yes gene_type:complete
MEFVLDQKLYTVDVELQDPPSWSSAVSVGVVNVYLYRVVKLTEKGAWLKAENPSALPERLKPQVWVSAAKSTKFALTRVDALQQARKRCAKHVRHAQVVQANAVTRLTAVKTAIDAL